MPKKDTAVAEERIAALVQKYESEISSGRIKKYTEEDVKKGFILPLFEALGWDTADRGEEIIIAQKIRSGSVMLNDIATNQRGAMLQKEVGDSGDLEVLGGAQISREGIRGTKGKVAKSIIQDEKAFIKPNAVLVQNIVAHIENPVDHIKIIAALPENNDRYAVLDTVNQLVIAPKVQPFVVWAILNSTLMNWYAYRFIFGKAIRTMHFDNAVTERIPMPDFKAEPVKNLKSLSEKSLDLQKQLRAAEENSNEWERLESEIHQTDKKIDEVIYTLYGLSVDEIAAIEKGTRKHASVAVRPEVIESAR